MAITCRETQIVHVVMRHEQVLLNLRTANTERQNKSEIRGVYALSSCEFPGWNTYKHKSLRNITLSAVPDNSVLLLDVSTWGRAFPKLMLFLTWRLYCKLVWNNSCFYYITKSGVLYFSCLKNHFCNPSKHVQACSVQAEDDAVGISIIQMFHCLLEKKKSLCHW